MTYTGLRTRDGREESLLGLAELTLLALIVFLVLGPKRLPDLARQAGRLTGQLRELFAALLQDLGGPVRDGRRDREPTEPGPATPVEAVPALPLRGGDERVDDLTQAGEDDGARG